MAKSPLQQVKDRFGSKEALVAKVAELVEPLQSESAEEHLRRLRNVANRKLLRLIELSDKVKAAGGRAGLVAKVLELKAQGKDHEYSDKLKSLSLGKLTDLAGSLQRRAKATSKAAAAKAAAASKAAAAAKAKAAAPAKGKAKPKAK